MITTKKCSKCGVEKPETIEFFSIRADTKKFRNQCIDCIYEHRKEYKLENKDKISEQNKYYRENNKEQIKIKQKQYEKDNKDKISKRKRKYEEENKEKIAERKKKYNKDNQERIAKQHHIYYEKNKPRILIKQNNYQKKKRNEDPSFKMRQNVSRSINQMLNEQGITKNGQSFLDHIGYTIEILLSHIKNQFEPWMTLNNYGRYNNKTWNDNDPSTWTWQLDHIIPHSTFKYITMDCEEFRQCWALSNLRPLSAKQNLLDGVRRTRHK